MEPGPVAGEMTIYKKYAGPVMAVLSVGAVIAAAVGTGVLAGILGFLAVMFAMINVIGGFLVTDRMLEMFKKVPGKR